MVAGKPVADAQQTVASGGDGRSLWPLHLDQVEIGSVRMAKKPARSGKSWTPKEVQQLEKEIKENKGPERWSRMGPRRHIGWVVAASLVIGLVFGLLLVAAPFVPTAESEVTGALLCGFALGWAMLASALRPVQ